MINKVSLIGDIVEIEHDTNGLINTTRRHVQNYVSLTQTEKEELWADIIGSPIVEHFKSSRFSFIKRIINKIRRK